MIFEVTIPRATESGDQSTYQIQASSWRSALAAGLAQTGVEEVPYAGAHVDIGSSEIRFTDPDQRRVIVIRSIADRDARKSRMLQSLTTKMRAVKPRDAASSEAAPKKAAQPAKVSTEVPAAVSSSREVGFTDRSTGRFRAIGAAKIERVTSAPPAAEEAQPVVLQETRGPTPMSTAEAPQQVSEEEARISETALEDVFLEIMDIFEPDYAMEDAIDFVLDLATKYVECETAAVMFASDAADHLYAAAARGKARKKLLKHDFDITNGVPARTLRDGIALALASPDSDSRHTPELAEVTGAPVNNIVAAPIQHGERAFGVMILVNRKVRTFFSQYDSNIVSYIASQMGKFIQEQLDAAPLE